MGKWLLRLVLCLASLSFAEGYFYLRGDLNLGLNGGATASEFAVDTLENFGSNWRSLQLPLETARSYEDNVSPFFMLTLGAGYKSFSMMIEAPLKKDIEAWYDDDLKTNFTVFPSELNINVPTKAYARWDNELGFVQVGRFKPDLGPSENTLTIGGTPYHDALWWQFNPSIFRYDFLLISLNAWLHGDTVDEETGCPPYGTEAYAQKCPEVEASNQRGRVYDENYKNLVFHRIGIDVGFLWVSVAEMVMLGGKSLEFRMINPFMFLHNNFTAGYAKATATFEVGARPAKGSTFYGQVNLEDITSPVGETSGSSGRAILSYLVGYRQELETRRFGRFEFQFDVVLTDPAYNHGRLPLLAYTGRTMYRSNYRDQDDPDFADMFYVDYPIGYRRGPDALDMWLTLEWALGRHAVDLTLAYLRQGDKELYGSYDDAIDASGFLSGTVESQLLADVTYSTQWFRFLGTYVGGGVRHYENLDHEKGEDGVDGWVRLGVALSFEFVWGTKPKTAI